MNDLDVWRAVLGKMTPGPWYDTYSSGHDRAGTIFIRNHADSLVAEVAALRDQLRGAEQCEREMAAGIARMAAQGKREREALERLGSMEAFAESGMLHAMSLAGRELRARIDFARAALKETP